MKAKNIVILDKNEPSNSGKRLWAKADFIFAEENKKYIVLKNRYGESMKPVAKSEIIKHIFS